MNPKKAYKEKEKMSMHTTIELERLEKNVPLHWWCLFLVVGKMGRKHMMGLRLLHLRSRGPTAREN